MHTVLITGCSSGYGLATARHFHAQGWQVIATMRKPEAGQALAGLENVLVTRLDVEDRASAYKYVVKASEAVGADGVPQPVSPCPSKWNPPFGRHGMARLVQRVPAPTASRPVRHIRDG